MALMIISLNMNAINNRCAYLNLKNPLYVRYHDEEWGRPEHSDRKLFEYLFLEFFQSGLSWECILNKREAFREAFDGFDAAKIAEYGKGKCQDLLSNPGIIRNRQKIEAAVSNARVFLEIQKEHGSFDAYIWSFSGGKIIAEDYTQRTRSPLSDMISMDLRKRGMKFIGSTTVYAYLQAIGVINAHGKECDLHP